MNPPNTGPARGVLALLAILASGLLLYALAAGYVYISTKIQNWVWPLYPVVALAAVAFLLHLVASGVRVAAQILRNIAEWFS